MPKKKKVPCKLCGRDKEHYHVAKYISETGKCIDDGILALQGGSLMTDAQMEKITLNN